MKKLLFSLQAVGLIAISPTITMINNGVTNHKIQQTTNSINQLKTQNNIYQMQLTQFYENNNLTKMQQFITNKNKSKPIIATNNLQLLSSSNKKKEMTSSKTDIDEFDFGMFGIIDTVYLSHESVVDIENIISSFSDSQANITTDHEAIEAISKTLVTMLGDIGTVVISSLAVIILLYSILIIANDTGEGVVFDLAFGIFMIEMWPQ